MGRMKTFFSHFLPDVRQRALFRCRRDKAQRRRLQRQVFTALCVLALGGGALLWILNIEGIILGPWSSLLGAVFTVLSAIFALLQWQTQQLPEPAFSLPDPPLSSLQQSLHAHPMGSFLGVSKRKGALIVKAQKKHVGSTIRLCRGFDHSNGTTYMASNIVERWIDGFPMYVGIFHALEPGNYTVCMQEQAQEAMVTIKAGQVAEIDWRYRDVEKL